LLDSLLQEIKWEERVERRLSQVGGQL